MSIEYIEIMKQEDISPVNLSEFHKFLSLSSIHGHLDINHHCASRELS